MARPSLKKFRRIVVKVGSSLLVDQEAGEVRASWLSALAADLARLHGEGRDILIVSSGAIALGRGKLKLPRGGLKLEESQGAAAVGQIALARIWSEVLGAHGIGAGQVLVTLQDTEERRRYLNARSTIAKLLEWRAVPVINENDTVATNEIRYGDNDRLAARVATMASAGKSLLPAGVIRVDGQFARGDAVVVRGPDMREVGRGLVAYDAEDADRIKGRSSGDVMTILGISGRAEMIHRDDLVVGPARPVSPE